jgi:hypothetical protein
MFIVATGAAAALVAPMASGSIDRSLPWDMTGQQQSTSHRQLAKKLTSDASKTAKKAKTKGGKPTGVVYVFVPAPPLTSAIQMPYVDACVSSGSDCTPQDLCDIWGMNCPAPAPDASTDPQAGSPANP